MNPNNDTRDRKVKQETRAWQEFTDTAKYTTALRQIESPLARGFLGEQVSPRHLINTLDDHPLIGADGGAYILGEAGFRADSAWRFDRRSDYIELALLTDFLRMFTPLAPGETPTVSSYSLKHTAEAFLKDHCSYVSNGRLIWAAAALGLPIKEDGGSLNVLIGVAEPEHDYVRRIVLSGDKPRGHHYRPAGYTHLETVLAQYAAGEFELGRWEQPEPSTEVFPFHQWLMRQVGRDDVVGDLAGDYSHGISSSTHRIARTPNELLDILQEIPADHRAYASAEEAIVEWARVSLPSQREEMSIRTALVSGGEGDTPGWGAGSGSFERYEYQCPCGEGTILEEHDNIPGFRDHDVRIFCEKCREEWDFVPKLGVRQWRLEPKPKPKPKPKPNSDDELVAN